MTEQHDVRRGLFFFAQYAVLVGIQQAKDGFERRLAMSVLEDLDVDIFGGILLKALRDLDGTVVRIVMADESAYETDQNIGWALRIAGNSTFSRQQGGSCGCEQEEQAAKRTESNETKHAELLTNRMTELRGGMRLKIEVQGVSLPEMVYRFPKEKEMVQPEGLPDKAFGVAQPCDSVHPLSRRCVSASASGAGWPSAAPH